VDCPSAECIVVAVSAGLFTSLRELAESDLSEIEQRDCKYLLLPDGGEPTLSDFGRVHSLSHLLAHFTGRWLIEMLAERRLVTHFQPIVQTDDPEQVFGYECLLRGVDETGSLVSPGRLFETARNAKLLYHLDRGARLQHIAAARRHGLTTAVFINFNPTSIYDPEFCLKSTVAAIQNSELRPENIVFEVVESDRLADTARLPEILAYYRRAGFRVALDDVGAGYSSLNLLGVLRPDFIKLDMDLIRGIDSDAYKGQIVCKLIELAHNLEIQVIAEGVETIGEWNWAAANGADFTQGYLFGKPTPEPQASCAAEARMA
jgi:EAL domain-containing protein (putative c-di-GMP-specific phosphodiesterase class I)